MKGKDRTHFQITFCPITHHALITSIITRAGLSGRIFGFNPDNSRCYIGATHPKVFMFGKTDFQNSELQAMRRLGLITAAEINRHKLLVALDYAKVARLNDRRQMERLADKYGVKVQMSEWKKIISDSLLK